MTQYYNMTDCFDACGDDDAPYIEGFYNIAPKHTKAKLLKDYQGSMSLNTSLSDKWQIQRAEPKVMTADRWTSKHSQENDFPENRSRWLNDLYRSFSQGKQAEYQRHADLRDAVKTMLMWWHGSQADPRTENNVDRLNEAFKALTPPEG